MARSKVLLRIPRGSEKTADVIDPHTMEVCGFAHQIYSDGGWAVHVKEWAGYTPPNHLLILDDNWVTDSPTD